jgi:predicted dehydrogenase
MAHGIGIIGLGVMGERMLTNMRAHGAHRVTAVFDPSRAAMERLRHFEPADIRVLPSADALVHDPAVECVYIASPPASHLAHAARAFAVGKPVFCEKPLSVALEEARAMTEQVERDRLRAAVNFPFSSAPAARAIHDALAERVLGRIARVEITAHFARWPREWQSAAAPWLAHRKEGGFVREVVSHFLFLTHRELGRLTIEDVRVDYPADGTTAETSIAAALRAGEVPVTLSGGVGTTAEMDENSWTLFGERGDLRLHNWYSLARRSGGGAWEAITFGPGTDRQQSYTAQLDSLDRMLAGKPHTLASFREAFEVQSTVEALLGGS